MADHYSSEEEEVFFGSLAESEMSKRRHFLGSNYNSPVTPRPPRFNQASSRIRGGLPDVLNNTNTSTPLQSTQRLSVDSCDDVVILDSPGISNSVITISDDEESLKETSPDKNTEAEKEFVSVCELSNRCDENKGSESHNQSVLSIKDPVSNSVISEDSCRISVGSSTIDISLKDNSADYSVDGENETDSLEPITKDLNDDGDSDVSFLSHEKSCLSETAETGVTDSSLLKESASLTEKSGDAEMSCSHKEKQDFIETSVPDADITENFTCESDMPKINNGYGLCDSNLTKDMDTNSSNTTNDYCVSQYTREESTIPSLIQDIDEFVGDLSIHDKSATFEKNPDDQDSLTQCNPQSLDSSHSNLFLEGKDPETSGCIDNHVLSPNKSSELQKNVSLAEHVNSASAGKQDNNSFGISRLSNFEFSLNGITDSILNISHGSSLSSPSNPPPSTSNKMSNLDNDTDQDLHMSVDEVDLNAEIFSSNSVAPNSLGNSLNTSQPSEYRSCPSTSSYSTACDKPCGENSYSYEQADSFQNYRDEILSDVSFTSEMDGKIKIAINNNTDEANFEMVLQNRQNSFDSTPIPASKISKSREEGKLFRGISKLPVHQQSKSLLRPPKIHVSSETLKTSSNKFAKQVCKVGNLQKPSALSKLGINKTPMASINKHALSPSSKENRISYGKDKTVIKTPGKIGTLNQNMPATKQSPSLTKSKIPSKSYVSVNKTPAQSSAAETPVQRIINRTPAQNTKARTPCQSTLSATPMQNKSGIPVAVKSDSKIKRVLTPLRDDKLNALSAGKGSLNKNKYKNIISPIQAYIKGAPPMLRKAQTISVENLEAQSKPLSVSPQMPAPRALQKLQFDHAQGQENVNPNIFDASRDTLPCKVLEPALEVFWKEGEQPQTRLPKMGEKHSKILAGPPKVKLTVHEGRVCQSPSSRGILIPNNKQNTSPEGSDIENLPSGKSDRISVRIQKIVDLP